MEVESSSIPGDLITDLEQATLMAKQLPIAPDPSHLLQIHAALRSAHRHLSLFLHPENPVSSAGADEPMQIGDDEDEQNSRAVEKLEGRLREFSIRNKRLKRPLSPSAMAEPRRNYEDVAAFGGGAAWAAEALLGNKLRALDLVYQFHA